jgi:hypothetical protein
VKQKLFIIAAIAIGVALSFAIFTKGDGKALSVSQVGADPFAYTGTITVAGVMAGISPENPAIFGMFDVKELQCKTENCNKIYLPVRHQGTMPVPGDEVLVTGSFVPAGGSVVFAAKNIKVVRHHKIGG